MELLKQELGAEGEVAVVVAGGKLSLVAKYDSKGLDGEVKLSVDSDYFIDELKAKIPGVIDDAILEILKNALKAM
jgi:hypothetical protein